MIFSSSEALVSRFDETTLKAANTKKNTLKAL